MQIIGSTPSPYVRRLRVLLEHVEHEFIDIDIFSDKGKLTLFEKNPARKIPVLVNGDDTIIDSRIIFRYLSEHLNIAPLTWEEENTLTLIDAANDSLVELLLCIRSDFDITDDRLFFRLQRERVASVCEILNGYVESGKFEKWNYVTISLACLLDWALFRNLLSLTPYPALERYWQEIKEKSIMKQTDPR